MDHRLDAPQGSFELQRLPRRRHEPLRAWDAADEYLLQYLAEDPAAAEGRLLLLNDSFGALAVALHAQRPTALSDSFLSQAATRDNLAANGLDAGSVTLLNSLEEPEGVFDSVLIKVPKTLALLEEQLLRLRPHLAAHSRVVAAGMVKALPATAWKLIARIIGPTRPSPAQKKARLIFAELDPELAPPANPYPSCYTLEQTRYRICNHANVFSRESLDIGTRFFLEQLPERPEAHDIIDLGCGNGVVGLIAAERNPGARLHFVDESFMAVASAESNFRAAFGDEREAHFIVGDALSDFAPASADLILCNPPFHQQHSVGDQIAQRMFRQAHKVLRAGGEMWVIGNRHLGYHLSLKRLFGHAELVASNSKFVILRSRR